MDTAHQYSQQGLEFILMPDHLLVLRMPTPYKRANSMGFFPIIFTTKMNDLWKLSFQKATPNLLTLPFDEEVTVCVAQASLLSTNLIKPSDIPSDSRGREYC